METKIKIPDPNRAKAYFEQKLAFTTGPVEVNRAIQSHETIVVVDVRAAEDYAKAHIPGAINVPSDSWRHPEGLRKDAVNIIYCYTQQCHLGAHACAEFAALGFPVMEMDGGFEAWQENELETESGTSRIQQSFAR